MTSRRQTPPAAGAPLLPDGCVTVLMGIHNGASHLPAQLQSIAAQKDTAWRLICSDDGSRDASRQCLNEFATRNPGRVTVKPGPERGFSANFMQLIRDLPDDSGPVALADQDDIWMPDKLARAVTALEPAEDTPALYAARRWYWDPETDQRQASPQMQRPCLFRNALIENVASGNTIVMNAAAAQLARAAARRTTSVFAHDWWLYLLISGAGGQVTFDNGPPCLLYRQHAGNVIGSGSGLFAQMRRKRLVMQGALSDRLKSNIAALNQTRDLLTPEARDVLDQFAKARAAGWLGRLVGLHHVAPYRQNRLGTVGFWGAASLGRI